MYETNMDEKVELIEPIDYIDNKIYTVTLADGTVLSELCLNGNNFISETEISPDVFEGNCSPVVISDGEAEEIHEDMALIHATKMGDECWFALRDIPADELAKEQLRADVDFIAAITGVTL